MRWLRARKMASLEETLRYRNREVVLRFVEKHGASETEAEELFTEMLKLLWLLEFHSLDRAPSSKNYTVFDFMVPLDEMWHTFILFTWEYTQFCRKHFGHYLHHAPTPSEEKAVSIGERELIVEVKNQCRYTAEVLGAATARQWFLGYPSRFVGRFGLERACEHETLAPVSAAFPNR